MDCYGVGEGNCMTLSWYGIPQHGIASADLH